MQDPHQYFFKFQIFSQSFQSEYDRIQSAQEEAEKKAKQLSLDLQQSVDELAKVIYSIKFNNIQ